MQPHYFARFALNSFIVVLFTIVFGLIFVFVATAMGRQKALGQLNRGASAAPVLNPISSETIET